MADQRVYGGDRILVLGKKRGVGEPGSITIQPTGPVPGSNVEVSGGAIAVNMRGVQYVTWDDEKYDLAHNLL